MLAICDFDPQPAFNIIDEQKRRRSRDTPKAAEQAWFGDVF